MTEKLQTALREIPGPNPPNLISQIANQLADLIPDAASAGGKWMQGKGEAEIAKAMEIRAAAVERLANLELERLRMLDARVLREKEIAIEQVKQENEHEMRMFELETQRRSAMVIELEKIPAIVQQLRDLGVEVSIEAVKGLLPGAKTVAKRRKRVKE